MKIEEGEKVDFVGLKHFICEFIGLIIFITGIVF